MSRRVSLSRRGFLKLGAVGGGLLLGLRLPVSASAQAPVSAQAQAESAPADLVPNAWVRVGCDGSVLFLVGRSEMGQGVMTALPMLIAEELGVGLDQVTVRFAPSDPAYANELLGEQVTSGSTSVRDAWTRLREAGAVARTLLVSAAAARWGVPAADCRVERAEVIHPGGDERLGFGALATAAAALPLPSHVTLKSPAAWTLIGTPAPRLDAPDKVNGRARFGIDVRISDKAVASVERCPVLGGRLKDFDAAAAVKLTGVIAVLPITSGVAVVAEDTWTAFQARRLLHIDWDLGPDAALSSAGLRERFALGLEQPGTVVREDGALPAAFAGAASILEAVYETPLQAHACMEPMNCTADVRADGCDLYVPTQAQTRCLATAVAVTGLDPGQVRVHTTFLGGGFGRRIEQDFVRDALELSTAMARPVQVVWTRQDDIRHDFYRPAGLNRLRGALDADGRPIGWEHRIAAQSILARVVPRAVSTGSDGSLTAGAASLPYAIPAIEVRYQIEDTPVPVGLWRAGAESQNIWITECFLDELAAAGGQDPVALRRSLLDGQPRLRAVLDLAADKAGWQQPAEAGRFRGVAVAACFGSFIAQVAEVSVAAGQVRVHRVVCALDCGQVVNPGIVAAQMESGIVYGLTATLKGAITIANGRVEQGDFDDFPLLKLSETPAIDVHIVPSTESPGGVADLGLPPIAPAVCNAVRLATGRPVRSLPIRL